MVHGKVVPVKCRAASKMYDISLYYVHVVLHMGENNLIWVRDLETSWIIPQGKVQGICLS